MSEIRRRSQRTNAGFPPARFGFEDRLPNCSSNSDSDGTMQDDSECVTSPQNTDGSLPPSTDCNSPHNSEGGTPSTNIDGQRSTRRTRALSSTATSRTARSLAGRRKEVENKAADEIDILESKQDKHQLDLEMRQLRRGILNVQIEKMKVGAQTTDLVTAIKLKEDQLEEQDSEIAHATLALKFEVKKLERRKMKVRRDAEMESTSLQEESENEFGNLSQEDRNEATSRWAAEANPSHLAEDSKIAAGPSSVAQDQSPVVPGPSSIAPSPSLIIPQHTNLRGHLNTSGLNPSAISLPAIQNPTAGPPLYPQVSVNTNPIPSVSAQSIPPPNAQPYPVAIADTAAHAHAQAHSTATEKLLARQGGGKDLPTFSGLPEEWSAFINVYNHSTKHCQFSDAENWTRLQKCLKGEAQKFVKGLLVSPESVPEVLEKLKMRFGRPEVIINTLINQVRATPRIKPDQLDSWIELGTVVYQLAGTIKSLDNSQNWWNPSLMEELIKKLPAHNQLEWACHLQLLGIQFPSLDVFATWLDVRVTAACTLCPPNGKKEETRVDQRRRQHQERVHVAEEQPKSAQRPRGWGTMSQNRESSCPCCGRNNHQLPECRTFQRETTQGRWDLVKKKKLCFQCFASSHGSRMCRSKRCGVENCTLSHHALLHSTSQANPVRVSGNTLVAPKLNPVELVGHVTEVPFVNLMVLPVKLQGPKATVFTYAMLDNGSTLTAIQLRLAEELGLEGEDSVVQVKGFQSAPIQTSSKIVNLKISSIAEDFSHSLKNVRTYKDLDLRQQSVRKSLLQKWPHLQGIGLDTYENKYPGILIGSDNPTLMLSLDHRVGSGNAPVAVRTPLGWAIMGNTGWSSREQYMYNIRELVEDPLHQLVKEQFLLESFGAMPNLEKLRSKEDERGQSILDSTVRKVDGGWETGLLWRQDQVQLPESRGIAFKRLKTMERKMDRDPAFAQQYLEKIEEYQKKGFARVLSKEETRRETAKTFYLPHFMACNLKKPGKLRFVFDAAAKTHGSSLNDHLLPGPDKLTSLPGILLKFRQRRIAFTADIQDMFHRVKVRKEDAQAQRFLWRGLDRERDPDVFEMGVLIFGATCSPACAQEAKNLNALEFQKQFPEACDAIVQRHYVDDYLDCCDTLFESKKRFDEVFMVQSHGGFKLCNWYSSSPELMSHIPEDLRGKKMKNMDMGIETVIERILGLFWRPEADDFTFSLAFVKASAEILQGKKTPTKRQMLSLVMSIFDPLGFLAVLTIKAKIMLQTTWTTKIGWDDEIPTTLLEDWRKWLTYVHEIPRFSIPRCYSRTFSFADNIQLHIFCDASQEAFGAVAYFRIQKAKTITTTLVMAKSKVAPLKTLSIPRLELLASVLGVRLSEFIKKEHEIQINRTVFWSDSATVIKWIRSDSNRFLPFVSHRIGEIQESSDALQWKWVPTAENVADEMTRLRSPYDVSPSSRWVKGPDFLQGKEKDWPCETWSAEDEPTEQDVEIRKHIVCHVTEMRKSPVIIIVRFSRWRRLIRSTAYVLRAVKIFRRRAHSNSRELTCDEEQEGINWWCKTSQMESFPEEYAALSSKDKLGSIPKSSRLFHICPILEGGIIRIRGRLDKAVQLPNGVKRPIVLDPKHPYTRLLISHFHTTCGHHGQERIQNEVRQHAYVFHLRAAVKQAQMACQRCQNARAKSMPPEMGQLPSYRLEAHVPPFNSTGVDYFGPIEVVVKRSREKRYGVLFSCMSIRAIHLEIAHSLSTDSCIQAIRRFVARRGCPTHIYSDNGTNFHGADNELRKALKELDQDQIQATCTTKGITWHFNPPAAPHMGGSWERMVRSVKVALGAVLKERNLRDETLMTLFTEAEHTVNSHPLTHVPIDPEDDEALTPNHFLIGRSSNLQPIGRFDASDLMGRKHYRTSQHLANHFWKRWIREFLPTLLRREKWCQPTRPVREGDIVLEVNESLERNQWPKGVIIKLYPGKDGVTRVVDVKMANGNVYKRPVTKLCILDVRPSLPSFPESK